MSMLLEIRDPPIADTYMALFPHLLTPILWDRPGNIPPLVRLLQAYIEKVCFSDLLNLFYIVFIVDRLERTVVQGLCYNLGYYPS